MYAKLLLALAPFANSAYARSAAEDAVVFGTWTGTAGYNTSDPLVIGPDNAACERKYYQVSVSSNNSAFSNVNATGNNTQPFITSLMQNYLSDLPGLANFTAEFLSNGTMDELSNTYNISGTLCTPHNETVSNETVQFLVHGIGFDSSYWNFRGSEVGVPENYSYIRAAADAGYTTFRYDRLGTGLSEHPDDSYNVVQAPTDLAIAEALVEMLRNGTIGNTSFSNVIGVGHSYGSKQVASIAARSPSLLNHVVLTGFSSNTTGLIPFTAGAQFSIAADVFPDRFANLNFSNSYLTTVAPQANQFCFLYYPYFTEAAAALSRNTEQPVTQGVLFTQGGPGSVATVFSGTVAVVTGDRDFPFCDGDCYAVPPGANFSSIPENVKSVFPAASNFTVYLPANTGHGIAAHMSAPDVNVWIQNYLSNIA